MLFGVLTICTSHGGFRVVRHIALVVCFLAGWFGLQAGASFRGLFLQLLVGSRLSL